MTSTGAVAVPPAPPSRPAPGATLPATRPGIAYASWSRRVVAALLDNSLLAGVTWLALRDAAAPPSLAPTFFMREVADPATPWWHSLWVVATFVVLLGLQGDTGWTPGKLVAGIAVVREKDLRPAGFVRTLLRLVAHLVDAVLLIGYLRPLWETRRRTFADSMLETVVVRRRPDQLRPGWELALTLAALLACLTGLGLHVPFGSAGGSRLVGEAACTPVATRGHEVSDDASVSIQVTESWGWDRHLWVRVYRPTTWRYEVTWPLPAEVLPLAAGASSAEGAPEPRIVTTVEPADGGPTVSGEQPVREWEWSEDVATVQGGPFGTTATAVLEDVGPQVAEPGRLTTAVLLDDERLATCTVPALALFPGSAR